MIKENRYIVNAIHDDEINVSVVALEQREELFNKLQTALIDTERCAALLNPIELELAQVILKEPTRLKCAGCFTIAERIYSKLYA